MWKRILKYGLTKLLDTDEFRELIVSTLKKCLPALVINEEEEKDIADKLIDAIMAFVS